MSTNFFLTLPACNEVHLGKRSAGWAFTFNAATVMDTEVRTRTEWERLVAMAGGNVTDEVGREFVAAEFWAQVDATVGKRSTVAACAADEFAARLVERGDVWTDADGWDFHRGDWC